MSALSLRLAAAPACSCWRPGWRARVRGRRSASRVAPGPAGRRRPAGANDLDRPAGPPDHARPTEDSCGDDATGAERDEPEGTDFQNTDEAKANPWPHLPELMSPKAARRSIRRSCGGTCAAPRSWSIRRRGLRPDAQGCAQGDWEIAPPNGGGFIPGGRGGVPTVPSVTKQLVGRVDNSACPAITVNIRLTLILPTNAPSPVPVMMDFGGGGGMQQYLARLGLRFPHSPSRLAVTSRPDPGSSVTGQPVGLDTAGLRKA